jgi:hypothetical protein
MPDNPFGNVEINQNLYNLYTILLQYLEKLLKIKHPLIHLITEPLDLLIKLREKEDLTDDDLTKEFSSIHQIAYKNISAIYDVDATKEQTISA